MNTKSQQAVGCVSDRETRADALRREDQQAQIEACCAGRGWKLGRICAERDSAIAAAVGCRGVLVVAALEHLCDSVHDCLRVVTRLREGGAALVSIAEGLDTSTAMGQTLGSVLASLARLEHDRLARRLPYGYAVAEDLEHIVLDPAQQAVIRRIVYWNSEGRDLADIARQLNEEGVAGRQGRGWDAVAVRLVLDHAPTSRWMFEDIEQS